MRAVVSKSPFMSILQRAQAIINVRFATEATFQLRECTWRANFGFRLNPGKC
jgi:hypothetical protein